MSGMENPPSERVPNESANQPAFDLEREKFVEDVRLRERELGIREREQTTRRDEVDLKGREFARSRWSSPLVLAVIGATLAGVSNAFVAWWNSREQRQLEDSRAGAARELERQKDERNAALEASKAEGARILEMIKTNDPDKAASNLSFLLDAGLASDPDGRIKRYLAKRKPGEGPVLPSSSSPSLMQAERVATECVLAAGGVDVAKLGAAFGESLKSNPLNLQVESAPASDGWRMYAYDHDHNLRLAIDFSKSRENITVRWDADYRASTGPTKVIVPVGQLSHTLLNQFKVILEAAGAASPDCRVSVTSR
jgi:hypothetical protein